MREVRVLHREGRERRLPSGKESVIDRGKLLDQHTKRPAVADDLVHGDQQKVFPFGHAQQASPQQGPSCEVERIKRLLLNKTMRDSLHLRFWQSTKILESRRH